MNLLELHSTLSTPKRYTLAVLIFLIALALRFALFPVELGLAFITFFPAMVLTFTLCDVGPGVLVAIVSALVGAYLFIPPHYSFALNEGGAVAIGTFLFSAYLIGLIVNQLHKHSESLHQSKQQLTGLLEDQTEVICRFKVDGTVQYVNNAFCQMFGKSRESLIGQTWAPVVHPEDVPLINEKLISLTLTNDVVTITNRIFDGAGNVRWVQFINRAIFDTQGNVIELQAVGRDVSDQKTLLNELILSERKFNLLAESMPQIVWITDANGKNNYFNQQWVDYTGLSLEESYGDGWIKPFHPNDRQAAWDAWQLATQTDGNYSIESRLRRADGIYHWWLVRGVLLRDESGNPVNWYGTCTDISAQKQTENSLRISATAFETQESIMVTNAQSIIIRVNQTFTKLTGYSEEDAVGQPVSILKSGIHDAPFYQAMWKSIHRDGNWQGEIWDKRKNGEVFPARMLISAVKDPEGTTTHYVGSFLDNTLQKQTETALVEAKSTADKANQAKSRFLAAASHDLRQPLAALSLYVDVLIKKELPDDRGLGAKIQACVNSLSELLNDLLDVSKLDAGVVTPNLSDFPINDLLQAMLTIHSPDAMLKGLRLHVRPSNWIGRSDFQIMQRILGNLVTNAIRYTNKGGILIGYRHHQGKQWIEVWDTGIGIPEDKTDSIFEEFTQLDGARNRGSGLGLAIVNKSAKLLGLQVRVRSRPGHGSMFAIEIPLGRAIHVEKTPISKPPSMGLKIGFVDDNAGVLEAFTFALNSFGYEVIAATSGRELFEHLGNQKPDILISDYRLGVGENGLDLIATARARFGDDLPAILITGNTDPELLRAISTHRISVCHKPLKIAALEAVILKLMGPKVAG